MAEHSIPVDLFNPGQVFACLGFLEAAEILLGDAEGGFMRDDQGAHFHLSAGDKDSSNPFEAVLEFLAEAEPQRWAPLGYVDAKKGKGNDENETEEEDDAATPSIELSPTFPAGEGDRMALPIRFGGGNRPIVKLGHWADASSRDNFKLYAGNRSADKIARAMLHGVRKKPTGKPKAKGEPGEFKTKGIAQLWREDRKTLISAPFDVLTPMGGSFNFDPRGAWTAINAGYSPNEHKHAVQASPVVEFLAAWGLEHARPEVLRDREVRYAVWGLLLPPCLARVALVGGIPSLPMQCFHFTLDLSGKNKVVTFAEQETRS
ncbi:MAG: hypothetical protein EA405_07455 [Rhodospirillales bacterium]|nr:MAG: hypothetical protein EA405_07455 [Rhodospirillales bacterium]